MSEKLQAQIGIIGGSGFYSFFEEAGTSFEEDFIKLEFGFCGTL